MMENINNFGRRSNHRACEEVEFYFYKRDEHTDEGIVGAEFLLEEYCGPLRRTAMSAADGRVVFHVPACTRAFLTEVSPAPGYRKDLGTYRICIDPCRQLWVNNCLTESFVLSGEKIEPEIF